MNTLGMDHAHRFDKMKKEVDSRTVHWYFQIARLNDPSLNLFPTMLEGLTSSAIPMGPFPADYFGKDCLGVPLVAVREDGDELVRDMVDLAFVSTNPHSTNIARFTWDCLKSKPMLPGNGIHGAYASAMCVQLATNNSGEEVVVAVDRLLIDRHLSYYEHPAGHRLMLAMNGTIVPEQAISIYRCRLSKLRGSTNDIYRRFTTIYNNRQVDYVNDEAFKTLLFDEWSVA